MAKSAEKQKGGHLNPKHPHRNATCACNSCAMEGGAGGSLALAGCQLSELAFYCWDKTQWPTIIWEGERFS